MKTKLLLVDDQEMNHILIKAIIKELPIELSCAYEVEEATELTLKNEYALILIDYHLQRGSGLDVLSHVKESSLNNDTPVIFISNHSGSREVIEKCYAAGAVDFVNKPIDIFALKSKLKIFSLMYEQKKEIISSKNKADALVDAKAEFLANMSHEIRTPLNAMIGMVDALSMSELTYEQKGYLDLLVKGGENLLTLINEILDYSKIEAGHLHIDQVSFDLKELCMQIMDFQSFKANEKHLSLFFDFDPTLPSLILSDSFRLRQILNNLLSNAIKFTDEGKISLTIKRKENMILFAVEDTGIGISSEEVPHVFKNFSQVGKHTSRRYGGTGLGLYISKGLVDALGGTIGVKSKKGKGSLFYFEIPLQQGKKTSYQESEACDYALIFKEENLFFEFNQFAKNLNLDFDYFLSIDEATYPDNKAFIAVSYERFMRDYYLNAGQNKDKPIVICPSLISRGEIAKLVGTQAVDYYVLPFEESMFDKLIRRLSSRIYESKKQEEFALEVLELPLRILVVDDVLENRMVIKAYLKNSNFSLDFIEDGSYVLEKVKTNFYHLILMDMQMPVMDGYEATKLLREWELENNVNRTPVVALTAYALQDEVKRCLTSGCDGHLSKPVRLEGLKECIAKYAIISSEELDMLKDKKIENEKTFGVDLKASDNFEKIDPLLVDYVPTYIKNRINEMDELKYSLKTKDFEAIRGSCHKVLGSAASYGLFQLEEIINKLQSCAREENIESTRLYVEALEKYLKNKKL